MISMNVKGMPLFRSIIETSSKNRKNAAGEFLVVVIFSCFPLVLTAILMKGLNVVDGCGFFCSLNSIISNGELILYCASFLSGTLYLVFSQESGQENFKERLPQGICVLLVLIPSYVIFLFCNFDIWKNKDFLIQLSYGMFIASLLLLYASLVFERGVSPPSLRDHESEQVNSFAQHMRGRNDG